MASLKSLQRTRGAAERRPACAEDADCPSLALRHPCCPIYPRHPYLPKGAKGTGHDA